jgi:hypothetical protein
MEQQSKTLVIGFSILCLALVGAGVYLYIYMANAIEERDGIILSLSEERQNLTLDKGRFQSLLELEQGKVEHLTAQRLSLESDKLLLEKNLEGAENATRDKSEEFTGYKELLKRYVKASKVMMQDIQAIDETFDYIRDAESIDSVKVYVDRYEFQLNLYKQHVDEYETILKENEDLFVEIGVDVTSEVKDLEDTLPRFDDILVNLRNSLD